MKDINTSKIINRDNLKVIRLEIKAGGVLAEHASKSHVLIVCVKGEGHFHINQISHSISTGIILEMEPNILHSVNATSDLEIIVIQMQLKTNDAISKEQG